MHPMSLTTVLDRTRIAMSEIADYAGALGNPALRLGVTGLSRAGKTVFITALVHNIVHGGRLALFDPAAEGRIRRAFLEPQPDDAVPRFAYEDHVEALVGEDRRWPESTHRMSQLRLTLDYEPEGFVARNIGSGRLSIDIVDYPGEWLLDLPLMTRSYEEWSRTMLEASRSARCAPLARDWHRHLATLRPKEPAPETDAVKDAELFRAYLSACRDAGASFSALPPGRFLMPGDLAGSPLLTFAPLPVPEGETAPKGSLWAMMARRYDAYVRHVVRPFFRDHFARLDRQIVLVDALTALNAGPEALQDLGRALGDVLSCFRHGPASWASSLTGRRIDRILFAATKADRLHHTSHDRLETITRAMIETALERAEFAGSAVEVMALAAIRATRETTVRQNGDALPCIVGVPEAGETIGGETFDGSREMAIFPGDLPDDPQAALAGAARDTVHFVRFRPPWFEAAGPGDGASFPHIRLDRALNFLLADRLA